MDEFPVEETGALCGRRQKPQHQNYFQLIIEWHPERKKIVENVFLRVILEKNNKGTHEDLINSIQSSKMTLNKLKNIKYVGLDWFL